MRYTGPKAKRCRRQGVNLFGSEKYNKILQKKPHGSGKNPKASTRGSKVSEYGKQLLEKQKVCDVYGVHNRQLVGLYADASRQVGETDRLMNSALERRLDNTLYRAGFALTRFQARQFISHGLFMVNGQRVTIASMKVKPGDTIKVRSQTKGSPVFAGILEAHQRYAAPDWLKVDPGSLSIEVESIPLEDKHFEQSIDMRRVIGFYSR